MANGLWILSKVDKRGVVATNSRHLAGMGAAKKHPTAGSIDSQRALAGEKDFDVHKQIQGRKRHILVDTLGLIRVVVVNSRFGSRALGRKAHNGKL
jgi:hypothetical protein